MHNSSVADENTQREQVRINLEDYLKEPPCIGEISAQNSAKATAIASALDRYPEVLQRLTRARLSNEPQNTIDGLREMTGIFSRVLQGMSDLLADVKVSGKLPLAASEGQDESGKQLRELDSLAHLLSTAGKRAMEELVESVDQANAGSSIHHAGLVMDIFYEMLDATVYSIPGEESSTEELLDDEHPHKRILSEPKPE